MMKWCHFGRYCVKLRRFEFRTKRVLVVFCLPVIYFFYICANRYYPHISRDDIDTVLYKRVIPVVLRKGIPNCTYDDILRSKDTIQTWEVPKNYDDFDAKGIVDGSYVPLHCNPRFSVAVLVTYRNRQKQLDTFLPYIHNFLRKQNIHYKIYLIEQQDEKPWNKGLLYNIGARQAIAEGFPCLILHDVDLLPLDDSNLYVCSSEPRHLSACIDHFGFVLLYYKLIGGVLAIRADQYKEVNGFSNRFLNWGGEDDDFYMRLTEHDIRITRFPRDMSRYMMLLHKHAPRNAARFAQHSVNQRETRTQRAADGLSHATAAVERAQPHRLFTLVAVHT